MRQLKITKQITPRTEDSINRYFQEINKYSLISPEEETELSVRIREGDANALEKLVVANLRFVVSVAKQYQNKGLAFSDLINEGNYGLVKAAQKFDETRGFKFISYAVWWIRQSITQAILDQTRIVRLPLNRLWSINKITKALPYLEQEYEREPTDAEIAGYLNLPDEEIKLANNIKERQLSFDMTFSRDGGEEYNLYDLVQASNIPLPDTNLMQESCTTNIKRALNKLTKREATILIMSFGLCNTPVYTLNDIALHYNMSSERIRQIRTKAICRLKKLLKEKPAFIKY